jgi:hypothetical protein
LFLLTPIGLVDLGLQDLGLILVLIDEELAVLLVSTAICRLFNKNAVSFIILFLFDESRSVFFDHLCCSELIAISFA